MLVLLCSAAALFAVGKQESAAPSGGAASAEGNVAFYANITSIEPLLEDFQGKTGIKG